MIMPIFLILRFNDTIRQVAKFTFVGMLGTMVDFIFFGVLHLGFHLPTLPANTLSYSAGIINNYLFHRSWTYKSHLPQPFVGQFARFTAVSLSALIFNNLVVELLGSVLLRALGDTATAVFATKLCAIGFTLCWNFTANHLWTFKTPLR